MKIKNTRRVNERIIQLFSRVQLNNAIGMALAIPVSMDEIVFNEPYELHHLVELVKKNASQKGIAYSEDQSIIATMLLSLLQDSDYDIGQIAPAVLDEIIKNGHIFHKGELESNAYYQSIHFDNQKLGRFELSMSSYKKYELFMYNTPLNKFQGVMIPALGTIDHRFKFPCIKENGSVWMTITPNEIYTMENPIKNAFGKVLTLGCGLGYFAYMVALKDNVESVTIVEKEPEVIELFTNIILPQFSCKDKINIIQEDAFDFMVHVPDGEYDYCFIDIWKGNTDTIPYLKMKKLCGRFQKTILSYWIEDAMIATIMGLVYMIILEEFYKNQNMEVPQIAKLPEDEEFKFNFLRVLLKDVEISRPEHVDYYMDYCNIIKLIK